MSGSEFIDSLDDFKVEPGAAAESWYTAYAGLYSQLKEARKYLPEIELSGPDPSRTIEQRAEEIADTYGDERVPSGILDMLASYKQVKMETRVKIQRIREILAWGFLQQHIADAKRESQQRLPEWKAGAEALMRRDLSQ